MNTRTYLYVCGGVALVTILAVLFVPGVSDIIEGVTLRFLSTNATIAPE